LRVKNQFGGRLAGVLVPEPYELENLVGLLAFGDTGVGIAQNPLFGVASQEDQDPVGIVNIELNEKMEFACPPTIPSSGAQRASRVGRRRVGGLQIPSHTSPGEPRASTPARVLRRSVKRPKLSSADRLLWTWLCEVWSDWRSALVIVKPQTVIAWHREGCRLFWTWKVRRGQPGRPPVPKGCARTDPQNEPRESRFGARPASTAELLKLGIDVGETSVGKYILRKRKPPSQNLADLP